jgi:hypothetical protein
MRKKWALLPLAITSIGRAIFAWVEIFIIRGKAGT